MAQYLKIGDFARAIGVSPNTVRRYEEDGSVIPHHKMISGQRLYSQEQVDAFLLGDFNNPVLKGKG